MKKSVYVLISFLSLGFISTFYASDNALVPQNTVAFQGTLFSENLLAFMNQDGDGVSQEIILHSNPEELNSIVTAFETNLITLINSLPGDQLDIGSKFNFRTKVYSDPILISKEIFFSRLKSSFNETLYSLDKKYKEYLAWMENSNAHNAITSKEDFFLKKIQQFYLKLYVEQLSFLCVDSLHLDLLIGFDSIFINLLSILDSNLENKHICLPLKAGGFYFSNEVRYGERFMHHLVYWVENNADKANKLFQNLEIIGVYLARIPDLFENTYNFITNTGASIQGYLSISWIQQQNLVVEDINIVNQEKYSIISLWIDFLNRLTETQIERVLEGLDFIAEYILNNNFTFDDIYNHLDSMANKIKSIQNISSVFNLSVVEIQSKLQNLFSLTFDSNRFEEVNENNDADPDGGGHDPDGDFSISSSDTSSEDESEFLGDNSNSTFKKFVLIGVVCIAGLLLYKFIKK